MEKNKFKIVNKKSTGDKTFIPVKERLPVVHWNKKIPWDWRVSSAVNTTC